ncbi:exo-rhamnogalacturonan lyase family protein [Neobacillus sp. Marseille-QA0830]
MKVKWLNTKPAAQTGVSWGVPWKQGALRKEDSLSLENVQGEKTPLQSWHMAFWPDGSVKWTGHAAILQGDLDSFEIVKDENATNERPLQITETDNTIEIDTGESQFIVNKRGSSFIQTIKNGSKIFGTDGRLVAIKESCSKENGCKVTRETALQSKIIQVEMEQKGPLRSVIKIEGVHQEHSKETTLLPFILRLYFFAGTSTVRLVHTFLYDADPQTDFIKGLGMEFSVPVKGELWNRNIRFTGDTGIYSEPAQLLLTRRHRNANGLYQKQIDGEILDLTGPDHQPLLEHAKQNAVWNDFKITQDSSDHYKIVKRTGDGCSWVESTHGTRAKGLIYVGGEDGGIAIGMKNFWQKFPSSLEVSQLSQAVSKVKVWFWAPDSEAMDFRHYSQETHVVSAYEGFDEMRATANGIANTSEVYLQLYANAPTHQELVQKIDEWQSPLLLVCEPEYYYATKALGVWGLPDRSTPAKAMLEQQLDYAFAFYKNEVEQRKWYGYWNYGDVMHTYDPVRHQWRYDLGGFAWQNTELVPNIWLWYAFLRSGREDIFTFAEAMTRHTSEVDRYHLGEYAGLGSRHNVVHWGCGCKEARISMAGLHKYYYFLTTDERTRDLLTEVRDADQALYGLDPMREFYSAEEYPTHARTGPDWAAFCSNWFSEWERTENIEYKQKIVTGIDILKKLPFRLLSGPTFGYDPETSSLLHMGDGNEGGYHMVIAFGGPQAWMEIAQALDDEVWDDMLAEFGEFYVLSNEEKLERSNGVLYDKLFSLPMLASGMVAYAAAKRQDENLAKKAWNLLLNDEISQMVLPIESQEIDIWKKLSEIPEITTNTTSQWCLNTIAALELIGNYLPMEQTQESDNAAIK